MTSRMLQRLCKNVQEESSTQTQRDGGNSTDRHKQQQHIFRAANAVIILDVRGSVDPDATHFTSMIDRYNSIIRNIY